MSASPSNSSLISPSSQFDVLVIGAGAAGLYAALCLPETLNVGLISKDALKTGASDWAQGGIAAAIAPSDSPQFHLEDTLKAGAGLCDANAVQALVEHAPDCIDSLVNMGVAFDRQGDRLALTLEAAHSRPRVLHAADTTGKALVGTLTEKVLHRPNIEVIAQAFALSLWLHPDTRACQGVSLLYENQIIWVSASAVILATGGGGQVFARTTNPAVSTGDGVAIAWRAGAVLRDLEFFQFHPTALTQPNAPHFLISEAVRGEGAHLVDEKGDRFAFNYDPAGELAPRDVVSRAIFQHLQETSPDPANAHVYLDLRPIPRDQIQYRFPNIVQVCQTYGIDAFHEPIPVAPAAHYWMGGIDVDLRNQTSIQGLYAIGETASTGVHGANRLASNSLLECLVFASQLKKLDLPANDSSRKNSLLVSQITDFSLQNVDNELEKIIKIRLSLQDLMWQSAGICRSQDILESAIAQVQSWRKEVAMFEISQILFHLSPKYNIRLQFSQVDSQLRIFAETVNLLDVAYLILQSATFRTESRGGHYRTDYPETSQNWQVHTLVKNNHWSTSPPSG